jgi:thymidylate kinase
MERNSAGSRWARPALISFSGVDGSGKSTQIENLRSALHAAGLTTRTLAFWDDVVVGVRYREGFVHRVYKSERGIGAPGKPVQRRDKNMRGWYLTVARHFLYLLDAVNLRRVVTRERRPSPVKPDVIILDRYIYDELANLDLKNPASRLFVKLVKALVPAPDLAYLLDADPAAACARKPEYPLDFVIHCRQSYLDLATLLGNVDVVPPQGELEARITVLKLAEDCMLAKGRPTHLMSDRVSAA